MSWIAAPIIVLFLLFCFYVGLIRKRNRALEALSGIDVQLNLRADAVPNILKIARRFMEHEHELLHDVVQARARVAQPYDRADAGQVQAHLQAAGQLDNTLAQLLVTVENYPELKSDALMAQAMESYNQVESHIAAARRFYNSAVTELNTSVQIFPLSVIAGMAGVREMPLFEASAAAREPVDADRYLK